MSRDDYKMDALRGAGNAIEDSGLEEEHRICH